MYTSLFEMVKKGTFEGIDFFCLSLRWLSVVFSLCGKGT